MDSSDGVGGKQKNTITKMSKSSDIDDKVNKVNKGLLVETLRFKCYQ